MVEWWAQQERKIKNKSPKAGETNVRVWMKPVSPGDELPEGGSEHCGEERNNYLTGGKAFVVKETSARWH